VLVLGEGDLLAPEGGEADEGDGRGAEKSTCLLLYKAPLGEAAKARLATMRDTEDGFRIAEEDLRLRGLARQFQFDAIRDLIGQHRHAH